MTELIAHLAGGFFLGFAGGLHCACMCGGLTSATFGFFSVRSRTDGAVTFAKIAAGRITAYATLGALAAAGASFASDLMAVQAPSKTMTVVAAAALMWIGFSTAGLLPAGSITEAGPLRLKSLSAITTAHDTIVRMVHARLPKLGPFTIGLSWGFAPCPLLYAALFMAMLVGTPIGGALWMIGFGVGTLPGVLSSLLGLQFLQTLHLRAHTRLAIGLLIVAFGFSTIYFDLGIFEALCRSAA